MSIYSRSCSIFGLIACILFSPSFHLISLPLTLNTHLVCSRSHFTSPFICQTHYVWLSRFSSQLRAVVSLSRETPQTSNFCGFWQPSTKYMPALPTSVCFKHKVLHLKSIRHLISVWIPSESVCDMKSQRSLRSCLIFPIGYTFIPLSVV